MSINDGRNMRALDTRAKILDACRVAMLAGCWRPEAQVIASLARRSVRSLFQHFPRMADLYVEALVSVNVTDTIATQLAELDDYARVRAVIDGQHPGWRESVTYQLAAENPRK